ncbi:MAG: hypothetical protein RIB67_02085 [Miltoncostaeaceae bacterium]
MAPRGVADALFARVETELERRMPRIDLLEFALDGEMMRVVVDHPDGVDHEVCVAVTRALTEAGLLEEHGLEVWSPGPEPPLRLARHFRAAVGRKVKVRTHEDGVRASVIGTLESVGEDDTLSVLTPEGAVQVPLASVRRARMLEEPG